MPPKSPKPTEPNFEASIDRLEQIVEEMEGEKLPLEKLLELYEEGTKLAKVCQEIIETAEKRIEVITRNSAGKPQLAEFEPGAVSTASSSAPFPAASAAPGSREPEEVSLF